MGTFIGTVGKEVAKFTVDVGKAVCAQLVIQEIFKLRNKKAEKTKKELERERRIQEKKNELDRYEKGESK